MTPNALYGLGYGYTPSDGYADATTADVVGQMNALYAGPGGALRSLRNAIPESPNALSAMNMVRGGLGTAANWLQGRPEIGPDTLAPLGLAGFGMALAPRNALGAAGGGRFRNLDTVGDAPRFRPDRIEAATESNPYVVAQGARDGTNYFTLDQNGQPIGYATVAQTPIGNRVDAVEVLPQNRGQGVASQMYDAIEQRTGVPVRPSGVLSDDGLAMWKKRDPDAVKWHQPAEAAGGQQGWNLSPKQLLRRIDRLGNGNEEAKRLFDALPPEAKTPEALATMFADNARASAPGVVVNGMGEAQGIRAYHGSPHDFDRFDMSKIGTGEGAQAYGHGLYFAESEGVARSYRDKLTDGASFIRPDGTHWDPGRLAHLNVRVTARRHGIEAAIAKAKELSVPPYNDATALAGRDLKELEKLRAAGGVTPNPGRMYEVNIKANADDFLDWDKPLSQQSERVRNALADVSGYFENNRSTPEAVRKLEMDWGGRSMAPAEFEARGIPGIRYLDQGSRSAGEGSRNLVVFDDALVEILRKYGLMGPTATAATYGALNAQQEQQTP